MTCKYCNATCIKKGFYKTVQRFLCNTCKRYQQEYYAYKICTKEDEQEIISLNNEGVGISGISRLTGISKANVVNRIKLLASRIGKPEIKESYQEYEIDEMHTFIGNKESSCYLIYGINKITKQVVDFKIGGRTKESIGKIVESVKTLNPKRIFTDKLNVYPRLIDKSIHAANTYKINHIERFNLTLRTHLKRLSRKTICFSKSREMLESCLRIYLWNVL